MTKPIVNPAEKNLDIRILLLHKQKMSFTDASRCEQKTSSFKTTYDYIRPTRGIICMFQAIIELLSSGGKKNGQMSPALHKKKPKPNHCHIYKA
jgi:hypothetical protein